MVDLSFRFERWFLDAGRLKSALAGVAVGSVFMALTLVGYGMAGLLAGFVLFFPLQLWLTISLFLVLFSTYERERLLGGHHSAFGGFVARLFGPFGLFCIGWFYSLIGLAAFSGTLDS